MFEITINREKPQSGVDMHRAKIDFMSIFLHSKLQLYACVCLLDNHWIMFISTFYHEFFQLHVFDEYLKHLK